jgi:hypothetical protein
MNELSIKMSSVILQWPSFGPYHTARLRACQALAPEGVEVVGIAVAGQVQGRCSLMRCITSCLHRR